MKNVETLEAEIKEKIIFIQTHFLEQRKAENNLAENIPKYLDSISNLENENHKLKLSVAEMIKQHQDDLKQIDNLVHQLSNLVETNNV